MSENKTFTISILGSGAWGTTLAQIASDNGHDVRLWTHDPAHREELTLTRINYLLPGILLNKGISFYSEYTNEFLRCDILIIAVASDYFRSVCSKIKNSLTPNTLILSATKGLDITTSATPYQIMKEEFPEHFHKNLALISGPNIALEIAGKLPATSVIASNDTNTSIKIQKALSNHYFRLYVNDDLAGVEWGGILKNVIAIAAGISDGLKLGNNAKASLLIRGIYEISRLAGHFGARQDTLFGLAGMGDLITTCSSAMSRNYQVGYSLGIGKTLDQIITGMTSVAEGIKTARIAYDLACAKKIDVPIIEQVYYVLYNKTQPEMALKKLMERSLKSEFKETN